MVIGLILEWSGGLRCTAPSRPDLVRKMSGYASTIRSVDVTPNRNRTGQLVNPDQQKHSLEAKNGDQGSEI